MPAPRRGCKSPLDSSQQAVQDQGLPKEWACRSVGAGLPGRRDEQLDPPHLLPAVGRPAGVRGMVVNKHPFPNLLWLDAEFFQNFADRFNPGIRDGEIERAAAVVIGLPVQGDRQVFVVLQLLGDGEQFGPFALADGARAQGKKDAVRGVGFRGGKWGGRDCRFWFG